MASVTGMSLSHESGVEERAKILLVDDSPENLVSLEASLDGLGQDLITAHSGLEALRHLLEDDFAAILLDVDGVLDLARGFDGLYFETGQGSISNCGAHPLAKAFAPHSNPIPHRL